MIRTNILVMLSWGGEKMNKKILLATFALIIIAFPINFVNAKEMTLTIEELYSDPSGWIEIGFTFTKSRGPPIESIDITVTSNFVDWYIDEYPEGWGIRDLTENGMVYHAPNKKSSLKRNSVLTWWWGIYLPDLPLTLTWESLNHKGKVVFSGIQSFTPTT
jgi:hypothetical protein